MTNNWLTTLKIKFETRPSTTRCTRCLYDAYTPSITFDHNGVCNYCHMIDQLAEQYPTGNKGWKILKEIAGQIKREGRKKKFDVAVGVSGGCDSSYMLHRTVELGLRPLAVNFDNGWSTKIARENLDNLLKKINVELFTYEGDSREYDDIFRSFMLAGVREIDALTDIGLTTTLYMAAAKYGIRYLFNGHSFQTEGVSPLDWCYTDGKYIQSVHKQFGNRQLQTFPNLWLSTFLKYMLVNRIKRIRPLYYLDYYKESAKELLAREYDWQWYGGHHLENRMTEFNHTYIFPLRFGMDTRLNEYSALVRSGQMTREEGLKLIKQPIEQDIELLVDIQDRLGFSNDEMARVMTQPQRSYRDFKTYKETFERLRPFFWVMMKLDLVPRSFYMKYTKGEEEK